MRCEVVGPREYRGHTTGQVFIASLERNAARRAVARGDIKVLGPVSPALPDRWGLPDGWSAKQGRE